MKERTRGKGKKKDMGSMALKIEKRDDYFVVINFGRFSKWPCKGFLDGEIYTPVSTFRR